MNTTMFKVKNSINIGGTLLDISQAVVMGILNITPDSFYDGGKYSGDDDLLKRANQILEEGGTIIDIGGVSTRPGSKSISKEEELKRILPAVKLIRNTFPQAILSIDTYRSIVVKKVFDEIGPFIINDISGGDFDNEMYKTVANLDLPYIMMHIHGTPENMQNNPGYKDINVDIIKHFTERITKLKSLGAKDIILDPGFGFGKTIDQNYELLDRLEEFKILELPILVGISRKSMIYKALNITPEEALNETILLHGFALERGAKILRAHDVKEAYNTIELYKKINSLRK